MKILTARPHRLLAACVDRLGEATARGEGCMFLVPSQYTLQAELEIMERLHVSGSFLIDVLSPKRLQSRVFELAGMPKQTLFDERGKCMVLSSIIEAQKDELSVYRGAAQNGSSGFTARVSNMIASLKRSGLSAADVAKSAESMDADSPAKAKLGDIARIYAAYEQRMAGELADASERRARFFAGANHDLRQPLQAMGIYLQILQAKARPEDRETIEQLTKTARNISELVEQILEVSRIETGNVDMRIEKVSVPALFDGLAQEFAPVAAAKGFIFQVRPLDAFISTDEKLFSRILRNLISNAIRYSSKPASKIILAAKRRQGKLVIGVYDQGAGIKPEDRERIFDAFFRGGSSEGAEEGFGLGLSIVRALASRLSIPVDVKSRWGKGSIFLLSFEEIDTKEKTTGAALPLTTLLDIRGTVGFLEDNAIVRQAVTLMMKGWGGDIIDAGEATADFVTALVEKDTAGELTAFVSDYNLGLGKPTGLDVIFSLRKACSRRVPCVLLTAVNEDDIRAHYRELCLNPDNTGQAMPVILQKPATPETLASALRQAIAEGQLR